ncbi:MAG: SH3 domain-containing protein [Clostridia bacterium]|nr:SH3 domain-containing protein [Clostridia bacterium]
MTHRFLSVILLVLLLTFFSCAEGMGDVSFSDVSLWLMKHFEDGPIYKPTEEYSAIPYGISLEMNDGSKIISSNVRWISGDGNLRNLVKNGSNHRLEFGTYDGIGSAVFEVSATSSSGTAVHRMPLTVSERPRTADPTLNTFTVHVGLGERVCLHSLGIVSASGEEAQFSVKSGKGSNLEHAFMNADGERFTLEFGNENPPLQYFTSQEETTYEAEVTLFSGVNLTLDPPFDFQIIVGNAFPDKTENYVEIPDTGLAIPTSLMSSLYKTPCIVCQTGGILDLNVKLFGQEKRKAYWIPYGLSTSVNQVGCYLCLYPAENGRIEQSCQKFMVDTVYQALSGNTDEQAFSTIHGMKMVYSIIPSETDLSVFGTVQVTDYTYTDFDVMLPLQADSPENAYLILTELLSSFYCASDIRAKSLDQRPDIGFFDASEWTPQVQNQSQSQTQSQTQIPSMTEGNGYPMQGTCNANQVHVRKEANLNAGFIGLINEGDPLTVLEERGEWRKISYSKGVGWIRSMYINSPQTQTQTQTWTQAPTMSQGSGNMRYGFCNANQVHVRKEANLNAGYVGLINKGDPLTVLEESGEWRKISYPDGEGWIRMKYIDLKY